MKPGPGTLQFPALTGVRALAVYLVYLHHTNPFTSEKSGKFLHHLVQEFHVGVSIFFVLSGFLISYRYWDLASHEKGWFKSYLVNRVARVYPMYFIITTISFLVLFNQNQITQNAGFIYFMNLTFLRGFFDELKFTLVGQGWSLTVEECFYFLAPLLLLAIHRSWRYLIILPIGLIAFGCLLVILFGGTTINGFFDSYTFLFIYTFPGRCVEFFWGIGLAFLLKSGLTLTRKGSWFTSAGILMMVLLVCVMAIFGDTGRSSMFQWQGLVINNFLLSGAIVIFFYGLISENSFVSVILQSKPAILLGRSSYTFYLIHVGVLYHFVAGYFSQYVLIFLVMNILALILWSQVEEPLNKVIRKLGTSRISGPPAA